MSTANCASKTLLVVSTLLGAYAVPIMLHDWRGSDQYHHARAHGFELAHDPTGMRLVLAGIASFVALLGLMTGCVDAHKQRAVAREAASHMLIAIPLAAILATLYVARRVSVLASQCTGEVEALQLQTSVVKFGPMDVLVTHVIDNVVVIDQELRQHCLHSIDHVRHLTLCSIVTAAILVGVVAIHLYGQVVDDDDEEMYGDVDEEYQFTALPSDEVLVPVDGLPVDAPAKADPLADDDDDEKAVQAIVIFA